MNRPVQLTIQRHCIPNKRKEKTHTHNNYKLKMYQLTNDRLKTSRLHWGRTYLQWLFLNS